MFGIYVKELESPGHDLDRFHEHDESLKSYAQKKKTGKKCHVFHRI
jgi:hypothetical protein